MLLRTLKKNGTTYSKSFLRYLQKSILKLTKIGTKTEKQQTGYLPRQRAEAVSYYGSKYNLAQSKVKFLIVLRSGIK